MAAGTPKDGTGPLAGVRVVELGGIGPGPFAGMLLADLGADVVRVDRPGHGPGPDGARLDPRADLTRRGKRSVHLDLATPDGARTALDLAARADVLIEGFRPGVAERLGVGPAPCHARNPRLVYGRMTGWGQDGPLAARAGHDIGYTALSGALGMIGAADGPPAIPANLVGDYAGGALYLVTGVLAALHHARATGHGQVVDAAIVDGAAHLTTLFHGFLAAGLWQDRRAVNPLDGGSPFYAVYTAADGGHLAVGPLEPRFRAEFLTLLGITDAPGDPDDPDDPDDPEQASALRARIAARLATRDRDAWAAHFAESDACVVPVLSLREAAAHPHLTARGTFTDHDGVRQPAPAPRFSRTPTALRHGPAVPGADADAVARDWALPRPDAPPPPGTPTDAA
ncbi:CaiB/BaiF CoA transferase family protein [Streptomyces avicenniae]|uniref:CaiB/BaiF CoA transferase family protein n=1 Tax=Streptomyces avicenniae TaxID=500153 RepID=UPI00069C943E|nr:CaiB/BaiF CoA-transferase family protein [Streptomyces avicenniae]